MSTNYLLTDEDLDVLMERIKGPPQTIKGNLPDGVYRKKGIITVVENGAVRFITTEGFYAKMQELSKTT